MSMQVRLAGLMLASSFLLLGAAPTTKPTHTAPKPADLKEPTSEKKNVSFEKKSTVPTSQPVAAAMKSAAGYESTILAFEKADQAAPPAHGGVVFYGSSSIRMWKTLNEDFPGLNVINRGFGGSTAPDALQYANRIVFPYRPAVIVFYEGDNDLSKGRTPEQFLADCQEFARQVHAELPKTRILYLSVKPSVKRSTLMEKQAAANKMLSSWISSAKDSRLVFVDIVKPMLDDKGTVRADLFLADRLHMNRQGYKIWADTIRNLLHPPKVASADKLEPTSK
jgi:lysophospholipase L1-like esterase